MVLDESSSDSSCEEFVINRSPDNSPRSRSVCLDGGISVGYLPEGSPLLSDDEEPNPAGPALQFELKDDAKLGMDWPRETDERVENGYYVPGVEFHRNELEQAVER